MEYKLADIVKAEEVGLKKDSVIWHAPIILEEDLSQVLIHDSKYNSIHLTNLSPKYKTNGFSQIYEINDEKITLKSMAYLDEKIYLIFDIPEEKMVDVDEKGDPLEFYISNHVQGIILNIFGDYLKTFNSVIRKVSNPLLEEYEDTKHHIIKMVTVWDKIWGMSKKPDLLSYISNETHTFDKTIDLKMYLDMLKPLKIYSLIELIDIQNVAGSIAAVIKARYGKKKPDHFLFSPEKNSRNCLEKIHGFEHFSRHTINEFNIYRTKNNSLVIDDLSTKKRVFIPDTNIIRPGKIAVTIDKVVVPVHHSKKGMEFLIYERWA